MTSLTFEAHTQLTAIGEGVFMRCTGLTSVAIPDGVTTIGKYAFMSTSNLASVTIPASVTCISDSAFYNCYNLATITVDENSQLTTIGMNAFYISKWLRTHPDGLAYIGNVAYQLKGSTFDGSIREGTVGIADGCFASKSITAVTIPNTVKIIGTRAFSGCTSLTSIVIPNSVTCIGDSAFSNCTGMTSALIGRGVTTIGAYAFNKCHQLASIIIGSGVTTIGEYAFAICLTQRTLTIYATIPPKTKFCFYNNHTRPTLYVFSDCLDDYTDFYKWDPLTYTYAIPDLTANDAGGELGRWCTYYNGLADVTMPEGTTVYKAALNGTKNGVVLTPTGSRIVKAGEAVLLNTTAEGITIASAANGGTGDYEGNELRGVDIETPQTDGTTVYKAALNGTKNGVVLTPTGSRIVKAGEAVLLNTTAEGITIASAADGGTGDYEGNELRGVDIETPQTDGTTYYVLSKVGDQFGFFKLAEGTNLAANKAYLLIPASAGARSFLGFGGDDSTGIDTPPLTPPLAGAGSGCAQEEGEWFSLDGRRLSGVPTQKGVYVRDGKKFIIK